MDDGDFSLLFRQITNEFVVELVKIVDHDVFVFMARMKEGGAVIFVAIELEILWSLGEAENIDILVFEDGIFEYMNVVEAVEFSDELGRVFGVPFAFVREGLFLEIRLFAVIVVIAERDEHWSDLAETVKPGHQTFEVGLVFDVVETVDGVATDKNVIGMGFAGTFQDGIENASRDIWSEMNVGNEEEFESVFVFRTVKFITGVIETIH